MKTSALNPVLTLMMLGALCIVPAADPIISDGIPVPAGTIWTARGFDSQWRSIASSSDGRKLAAVAPGSPIQISVDRGVTWTTRDRSRSWQCIAMSNDGSILAAAVYGGRIYVSLDGGATWAARDSERSWTSVAMSGDGTRLAAISLDDGIFISVDSGLTWNIQCGWYGLMSICMSADGTKLAAVDIDGGSFTSSDGGLTWLGHAGPSFYYCDSIAASSDGVKLVAGGYYGVSTSSDGGATWSERFLFEDCRSVCSSSDGTILATAAYDGHIYTSADSGLTWVRQEGDRQWTSITSSSDGGALAAVVRGGSIYTSVKFHSIAVTMDEDGAPTPFYLTLHASDEDDDPLTWSVSSVASSGTATVSGTGSTVSVGYTPLQNYYGMDRFMIQVADGRGGTDSIEVTVRINSIYDSPVITEGASVSVMLDESHVPTEFNLTLHATGDGRLTWSVSGTASHGTAIAGGINSVMSIGYVPMPGFHGSDSFVVQVADDQGGTDTTTVNVMVNSHYAPIITDGVLGAAGTVWSARESSRSWNSIASSSDGSKLAAIAYAGQVYTSSDGGAAWVPRDGYQGLRSIASSSDGAKMAAVAFGGQIYTSVDGGVTWTARDGSRSWMSIASSSDGTRLVAVVSGGQIYTSVDGGITWTARESNRDWVSIVSSSDGCKLAAVVSGGHVYISDDGGVTWTPQAGNQNWSAIASSSDGSRLAAVVHAGQIYTSNDGGGTWTARDSSRNWTSITSSSDGSRLAAGVGGGQIYTSDDGGVTWTARGGNRSWASITSSSDGTKLAAGAFGDKIYVSIGQRSIAATMDEDGVPASCNLSLHATDADDDPLTWSISSAAGYGVATTSCMGANVLVKYIPVINFTGVDSFVVQVSDGNGGTDSITVNVTINPINDAPIITEGDSITVTKDINGVSGGSLLTLHATDADGDSLIWSISGEANHGTATVGGMGSSISVGYIPSIGFTGVDNFVVKVADGSGGMGTIRVEVVVMASAQSHRTSHEQNCGLSSVPGLLMASLLYVFMSARRRLRA